MRRITFSMPPDSIIPAGVGALMLWAFVSIFHLLGYTNCTAWSFLQSTPRDAMHIIGALKTTVYLQAEDGTTYCNTQNQWKKCTVSTFVLSYKDAPAWLNSRFTSIPEKAEVVQLTHTGNYYSGTSYVALLTNHQVWSCPEDFNSKMMQIMRSGSVIWLIIPAAIGIGCAVSFMKTFIERGSPTLWDFSGRGSKIK